jgi:CDP-diglyceride synthetase
VNSIYASLCVKMNGEKLIAQISQNKNVNVLVLGLMAVAVICGIVLLLKLLPKN